MTSGALSLGRPSRAWLAVAGVAIAAAAAFVAPAPEALTGAGSGSPSTFAALASSAIVALSVLPSFIWRGTGGRSAALVVAAAAFALGIAAFSAGGYAESSCSANYAGRATLIGTDLTSLGAGYKAANPELSNDEILFDATGLANRIWTARSIDRCRTFLRSAYFLWIPFLVASLLAAAQAIPSALLPSTVRGRSLPRQERSALRYDVFLSYRHGGKDAEWAEHLARTLEADGYRVAIDERDFPANASFLQEMERCIQESRFTVAVISSRYLESGNCSEEAVICKVLDMGDRQRRLIPLVIEPVSMPVWLYGIVGIDCTRADPLVQPLDKLKAALGDPSTAEGEG
jgi:hypothetical protein